MRHTSICLCIAIATSLATHTASEAADKKDVAELLELVLVKQVHPRKPKEEYGDRHILGLTTGVALEYGGEVYGIILESTDSKGAMLPQKEKKLHILTTFRAKPGMKVRMMDKGLDGVVDTYRALETLDDINKNDLPPNSSGQNHYDQLITDLLGYYRLAQKEKR